jgi:hypothetical protein
MSMEHENTVTWVHAGELSDHLLSLTRSSASWSIAMNIKLEMPASDSKLGVLISDP